MKILDSIKVSHYIALTAAILAITTLSIYKVFSLYQTGDWVFNIWTVVASILVLGLVFSILYIVGSKARKEIKNFYVKYPKNSYE